MTLWGGRFNQSPSQSMRNLSRSVHFDWRLAPYEIEVNLVHLSNLINQKIVSKSDGEILQKALVDLAVRITNGTDLVTVLDALDNQGGTLVSA